MTSSNVFAVIRTSLFDFRLTSLLSYQLCYVRETVIVCQQLAELIVQNVLFYYILPCLYRVLTYEAGLFA